MLSDRLWGGTFQNRQRIAGGIRVSRARAAQLVGDATFVTIPIAAIAKTQAPAANVFICWSCIPAAYQRLGRDAVQE